MSGVQMPLSALSNEDNIKRAAEVIASRRGRENAISGKQLAAMLGVSPSTVRNWPPEIRGRYKVPVGYCEDGYFRISTDQEYVRERQKFESQAERARENMAALDAAYGGDAW